MLISTKGRYALHVMIELAKHDRDEFVPLKSIAEGQNISGKYLEAVITVLSKAGIIDGHRGKGGGYRLNRDAADYTVGEILRVAEGGLSPVSCMGLKSHRCANAASCSTLPLWQKLDALISDYLDGISLEDLVRMAGGNDMC